MARLIIMSSGGPTFEFLPTATLKIPGVYSSSPPLRRWRSYIFKVI